MSIYSTCYPRRVICGLICCLPLTLGFMGCSTAIAPRVLRLATTTSTRDSGLLEKLIPPFEKAHQVRIDVIAAGTGKALKLGEMGDVDLVMAHARAAEDAFMEAGYGIRREDVMYNTFELLGPLHDPAQVKGLQALEALQKIAAHGSAFISRGDDSGTHKREIQLWQSGGGLPRWPEYRESGQGMGATLVIADELAAYVLADRGTYLNFRDKIQLTPLAAPSAELHNPYGILVVNPAIHPAIDADLADSFVDFIISPSAQQIIADHQLSGESLFVPQHLPSNP